MPIYEYISENPDDPGQSCPVCRRGFELRRPVDRAPLEKCLVCKHPVRKVISRINVPEVTKPLSVSDAKLPDSPCWSAGTRAFMKNCDDKVPGNISAFFSEYII
nr:zinc ribbon domain-containing protein [Akkermansia muciniphila]